MVAKKAIIMSATSDIAVSVCEKWHRDGYELYGTYRKKNDNYAKLKNLGVHLFSCDMSDQDSVEKSCRPILEACGDWNVILFATGTPAPVGNFKNIDMPQWIKSVQINFVYQMFATHIFLEKINIKDEIPSIIYFAGGGTNNAVLNYSAYTISKIALIKMCELLDAEIENVKFSIIGPGWVKTKVHNITLEAGESLAGENYHKTVKKLASATSEFIPMESVIKSLDWVIEQPKAVVGGRNFSTGSDCFDDKALLARLLENKDMYKLRRHGNFDLIKESQEN